nr:EOG090X014D [Eurycercus lamellatus]
MNIYPSHPLYYKSACSTIIKYSQKLDYNWMIGAHHLEQSQDFDAVAGMPACLEMNDKYIVIGQSNGRIIVREREEMIPMFNPNQLESANAENILNTKGTQHFSISSKGELELEGPKFSILSMQLSRDNILVCGCSGGAIQVWNVHTRQLLKSFTESLTSSVKHVRFGHGLLLTGSSMLKGRGDRLTVWNMNSSEIMKMEEIYFPLHYTMYGLGFDDEFIIILVGKTFDYEIQVRTTKNRTLLHTLRFKTHSFSGFHYEAGFIAAGSDDGKIRFNSKFLITSNDNGMQVWNFKQAVNPQLDPFTKLLCCTFQTQPCGEQGEIYWPFQMDEFEIVKYHHHSGSNRTGEGVPYQTVLKNAVVQEQKVPGSADVVILGGGSIGCNTLYHLAKLGLKNVVLLERNRLTSGTTWHTAGLVWRLRPSDVDVRLLEHTHELLKNLEAETGIDPGYIVNGGLFVASSKERLDEYKRLQTLGKAFGIESYVLGPKETKELYPLMNVSDVYGTLYSPKDGVVDPAGFCTALTRSATRSGAQVIEDCVVTGIDTDTTMFGSRQVSAVRTDKGTIKTNCVVNCTGAWAPYIGSMVDVAIPLVVTKHAYVVTEKIEGISGMPNVRDHDSSIYFKVQGDSLSVGGYENDPVFIDQIPKDAAFSLYELDWDVFGVHIDGAVNRCPILGKTGIKSTVSGPESFTPDHKPLLGEEPTLRGFFHGCGFNSAGMMFGGGCGWQLAKWIVQGRPDLDMYGYDIRRFSPDVTRKPDWIRQRSHEAYAKNYSIVYPHDEPLASRKMKQSSIGHLLEQSGCVFQERHGWERPGWFSESGPATLQPYDWYGAYGHNPNADQAYVERLKEDYTFGFPRNHSTIKKECQAVRERVAVFDMSYFGNYYLIGRDAQAAADWVFTNDMKKPAGETSYTCMLNANAGVESDLTVSFIDGLSTASWEPSFQGRGFYIAAGGGSAYQSFTHIQRAIEDGRFDAQLINTSNHTSLLSIQGPKSRQLLEKLSPKSRFTNEDFPFSSHRLIDIGGHVCRALRISFVGEMGWELHVPFSSTVDVYKSVMNAGKEFGIANAGYRAIDSLSIEKGYRHWHMDLRSEDDPFEAGLAFTCKLKSTVDFLGRKALEDKRRKGLSKRIACFTIQEKVPLWGLEAIWRNDQVVGYLRRADYGFTVGSSIGYGYIQKQSKDGQPITNQYLLDGDYSIESMDVKYKARIHMKPLFDSENKRIKGLY